MTNTDPLLTAAQIADHLNVSESAVRRLIASGDLPRVKIGGSVRVRQSDADAYVQANTR